MPARCLDDGGADAQRCGQTVRADVRGTSTQAHTRRTWRRAADQLATTLQYSAHASASAHCDGMAEHAFVLPDPLAHANDDVLDTSSRLDGSHAATRSADLASLLASVAARDGGRYQSAARASKMPSRAAPSSSPDDEWSKLVTPGPEGISELASGPPPSIGSRRSFTTTDNRPSEPLVPRILASTIEARLLEADCLDPGRLRAIDDWRHKVTPSSLHALLTCAGTRSYRPDDASG